MAKADLTAARLRELFSFDEHTGLFTRRVRVANQAAGTVIGAARPAGGRYMTTCIDQKDYLAHRLAWLYHHGEMPTGIIDHINGDGRDNRIANLRDTTQQINNQNHRRGHRDGSSRFQGVSWVKAKNKWRASLTVEGKARFLGYFQTEEDAHALYVKTKRLLHPGCTI